MTCVSDFSYFFKNVNITLASFFFVLGEIYLACGVAWTPIQLFLQNLLLIINNTKRFDLNLRPNIFFFFWIRGNLAPPESALCGPRWGSKIPVVSGSYKRCTPWLELETCCADLKPFAITLRPLRTRPNILLVLFI